MRAGVAGQPFHPLGGVHQFADGFVFVVRLFEFGVLLKRIVKGDVQAGGDKARHAVDVAVRHCQGAADIADGGFRAECAECDYLRYMLSAVLVHHIVDDLFAAVVLEVHIDVGHLFALNIEEALKDQRVGQGVDIGNA